MLPARAAASSSAAALLRCPTRHEHRPFLRRIVIHRPSGAAGHRRSAAREELAAARAGSIKHFFSFACKELAISQHLTYNLTYSMIASDPHARITILERELAWAHLKIQALTEELRQQRVKLLGPRSETFKRSATPTTG